MIMRVPDCVLITDSSKNELVFGASTDPKCHKIRKKK